jgi:hypothetical protein
MKKRKIKKPKVRVPIPIRPSRVKESNKTYSRKKERKIHEPEL